MVLTSGCVELTELTAEEEEIVSLYSAKVVSKHNVRLSQGIVRYRVEEKPEAAEEETQEEAPEEAEPTEEGQEVPEENIEAEAIEEPEAEEEKIEDGSLADILGIEGIEFSYKDTNIFNDLKGQNAYVEKPASGNKYLGIKFDATNVTEAEIDPDILKKDLSLTATIGEESAKAKSMIMLRDDLPTFAEKIGPGESKELTVYFEFPEGALSDLSGLELVAESNGKSCRIPLK
jgi:hypothetical protein